MTESEILSAGWEQCEILPKYVCPSCGAFLDRKIEGTPGCGGDPEWHDGGVAGIGIVVQD